jgi:predicted ATPase/DNA-binding SARP family transcriptional activator
MVMSYLGSPGSSRVARAARPPRRHEDSTAIPRAQTSLVRVLGPLVLDLGGEEVRLKRCKPREIFLLLLLHRGESLRVGPITDAVWGGDVPGYPYEAIRSYVASIRSWIAAWPREVGGPVLRSDAGGYELVLDDSHLDLVQFTRLAARGQLALREGLPAAAVRDLDEALALFRGMALQDASNCTFAVPESSRLEEMRLDAREARALALLELGLADSAIAELWDLASDYPWRVRSAALLMVSLYRARRQVEALDCARAFRRALWTELGERPDPSFNALEHAILNQDAELDRAGLIRTAVLERQAGTSLALVPSGPDPDDRPSAAGRSVAMDPRPLLGRAEAENSLVSMLESARDVSIVGPVGCGKSALAARVAARFRDEMNARVVCVDVNAPSVAGDLREAIGCCLDDPALRGSEDPVLLLIDNCDALHKTVNSLTGELRAHPLPRLRVLRTSRRRDQAGSALYQLDPLPATPPAETDPGALLASPAVALFCQRAATHRRGFEPPPGHIPAVARICAAVDGLPLAIEMAAAQTLAVNAVELEPLLADDPFSVLKLGRRGDGSPSNLYAAFRRTYERLTSPERKMLGRLSAADQPFSMDEITAVGEPAAAVAPVLNSLVTHSIVACDQSDGSVRYRVPRMWRAFARTCQA